MSAEGVPCDRADCRKPIDEGHWVGDLRVCDDCYDNRGGWAVGVQECDLCGELSSRHEYHTADYGRVLVFLCQTCVVE